jgi:nucleoside phosphorylase
LAQDIDCDLLLFFATTTEKEQLRAVAKELGYPFERKTHLRLGRYYRVGEVGDFRVVAVQTEMGPLAYQGSASRGIFFKLGTQSTAIVQLGMAFGVDPARQQCGDVLVSSALVPYDRRRVVAHGEHYRIDYEMAVRQPAKPSMLELFVRAAGQEGLPYRVHTGAVLSGGTAIYSSRFRDELVAAFPLLTGEIVGGEMEGVGLLSISPPDDPAWIVVKGVSDFAEDDRPSDFPARRELACRNSAQFVLTALRNAKQP